MVAHPPRPRRPPPSALPRPQGSGAGLLGARSREGLSGCARRGHALSATPCASRGWAAVAHSDAAGR